MAEHEGFTIVVLSCRRWSGEPYTKYRVTLASGHNLPYYYDNYYEAEQAGQQEAAAQPAPIVQPAPAVWLGARVVRASDPSVAGTVINVYGRKARVCWDRALRGGSRIGGGVTQHSTVLVSSLRVVASAEQHA